MNTSKKILVVEDNQDCRELQGYIIRRLGYVVIEADNGAAAIDEALAEHPDLILMDLNMPRMNGDDAIVQLKSLPSIRDIPIVICTAYAPGARVNHAIGAGAVDVLHKPFKNSELEDLLRRHVPSDDKNEVEALHLNLPSNRSEVAQFISPAFISAVNQ